MHIQDSTIQGTWPPKQCRKCGIIGLQNFYRDTIQTITYRCRLCGTEHYRDIIQITGTNPKVRGQNI